jgi:hypothetical protein
MPVPGCTPGANLEPAIPGHSLHRLAERRPGHAQPVCQAAFGWEKGAEGKTGVEDRLDEAGFGHFSWLEWGLRVHGIPGGKRSYHSSRVHPVVDDMSKQRAPFRVSPERRVWSLQRPGNCGGGWPTWLLEAWPESAFRTKALGWHPSKRLGQGSSAGPDGPVRARNAAFVPQGPGGRGFRPDL